MSPFLQLRLWWLRAQSGDRVAATLAAAVVVVLAAWVVTPTTESADVQVDAGVATADTAPGVGSTPGGAAAAVGTGQVPTEGGGQPVAGGTGTAPAGDSTGAAPGIDAPAQSAATCPPTPDGAPGITDDTIRFVMALLDLAGPIGNGAVGQQSAEDQQRFAEAIIAEINGRGGVACRQLEAKFYAVNPISPNATQAACVQMVADRPAVVVDVGGLVYGNAYNCTAQQQVPTIELINVLPSEIAEFAPYLAGPAADFGSSMRAAAQGLREQGFFDPANGFVKLGLLMDECAPELNATFEEWVGRMGVTASQISTYTFACPESGFASPADMAQAVAQHRAAGVTHVVPLTGGGSFNSYTETAERQGYRPQYGITDFNAIVNTAESNLRPNVSNFDGAIAISTLSFGARYTPGLPVEPGTQRCQAIAESAGFAPEVVMQGSGGLCGAIWMLEAALANATALTPDAILPGLFGAGTVELAYPLPNATFRAPDKYAGGDTYWPIQWHADCTCWRVLDPNRRPIPQP